LLDSLDVSYNYFNTIESLEGTIKLPRLVTMTLYGNPVLGPTGEDPLYIYIEELINQSIAERETTNSRIPDVEVKTRFSVFSIFVSFTNTFFWMQILTR